ncbi:uncharacterized protein [Lolium perenne]|uniref:uncharacterized protein n=1 Tax=Lolium perenne TaxID=4522 RepID=UPI003A9A1883
MRDTCPASLRCRLCRRDVAPSHGPGGAVFGTPLSPWHALSIPTPPPAGRLQIDANIVPSAATMSSERSGQRQCRHGATGDVELDAAMALADMAGVPAAPSAGQQHPEPPPRQHAEEEEELASTRLSLELGKVGIQASPCSSSSSAGGCPSRAQQALPAATAGTAGYGPRPRHALTEAEKEAKRLRRVLANRESARQTILRRQAIRDELARKVADLSSQNESMKKEKETVMQEFLTLQETNKQLREQRNLACSETPVVPPQSEPHACTLAGPLNAFLGVQVVAKAAERESETAPVPMDTTPPPEQRSEATPSTTAQPDAPPGPSFLYTGAAPPAVPVPYLWGSWPGYEYDPRGSLGGVGAGHAPPPIGYPPCAWYYPVVADRRGSPATSYAAQPLYHEAASGGGSQGTGGGTAEEDTDDDPCSLTLGLDVTSAESSGGRAAAGGRERAAEARRRRKELTKLKQTQPGGRPGDE